MFGELPGSVCAVIEVPKWSFIKRELHDGGGVDFVSPVPCPFNYGHVPGMQGQDGDPVDALVLGSRRGVGSKLELPVFAVVRFLDGGCADDKLVLAEKPPTDAQILWIRAFFVVYTVAKKCLNNWRGIPGSTGLVRIDRHNPQPPPGYDP